MDYGANDADIGTLLQAAGFKNLMQEYLVYTVCPVYKRSKNYFYNFCKIYKGMDGIPFFIDDYSRINNIYKQTKMIGILSKVLEKEGNVAVAFNRYIVRKIDKTIRNANCGLRVDNKMGYDVN